MDAPTADEIRADPVVQAAFAAAWADSFADDPMLRHEEGGYIYCDAAGQISVRRAQPGTLRAVDLGSPPVVHGAFLVATYHTHPNPFAERWPQEPSPDDKFHADDSGVPWFVLTEFMVYAVGPTRRLGGLSGPPGYPR